MAKASDILDDKSSTIPLPEGQVGRKGSIAATLRNIELFDEHLRLGSDFDSRELQQLIEEQESLLHVIHYLGLMRLFTPDEWLQQDNSLGRIFFTLLYLKAYPEAIAPSTRERIATLTHLPYAAIQRYAQSLIAEP